MLQSRINTGLSERAQSAYPVHTRCTLYKKERKELILLTIKLLNMNYLEEKDSTSNEHAISKVWGKSCIKLPYRLEKKQYI
jgi:hypothetical protein